MGFSPHRAPLFGQFPKDTKAKLCARCLWDLQVGLLYYTTLGFAVLPRIDGTAGSLRVGRELRAIPSKGEEFDAGGIGTLGFHNSGVSFRFSQFMVSCSKSAGFHVNLEGGSCGCGVDPGFAAVSAGMASWNAPGELLESTDWGKWLPPNEVEVPILFVRWSPWCPRSLSSVPCLTLAGPSAGGAGGGDCGAEKQPSAAAV